MFCLKNPTNLNKYLGQKKNMPNIPLNRNERIVETPEGKRMEYFCFFCGEFKRKLPGASAGAGHIRKLFCDRNEYQKYKYRDRHKPSRMVEIVCRVCCKTRNEPLSRPKRGRFCSKNCYWAELRNNKSFPQDTQ